MIALTGNVPKVVQKFSYFSITTQHVSNMKKVLKFEKMFYLGVTSKSENKCIDLV